MYEIGSKTGATRRGHRIGGGIEDFLHRELRERHFSPDPPKAPPPQAPPSENEAGKASAREAAMAAERRGKASTIIAGRRQPQMLGNTTGGATRLGGTSSVLGGARA
jgi:hypothetical protein